MELVFVRHGEPRWAVDGVSQIDPHLTERGNRQALLTAERLAAEKRPVREILVSPALRSQETAKPLAALTGVEPVTVPDLVEIRMPDWTGMLEATVQRIFAEGRDRSPEEWWNGIEGGESFRDFHERVTSAMLRILDERGIRPDPAHRHLWRFSGEPGRVVIVAHGGTNAVVLGFLLGADPTPWEWERFILYHASIARLRAIHLAGGHVFSLRTFNDREHLPKDIRTR
ncbi:phosphoserine phosphatase 1 [bacterium BMS3Abin02]|nr:phosphoserine phosphatase 1 [bacterium BMS3Abin02]